jgi:TolB-like protein
MAKIYQFGRYRLDPAAEFLFCDTEPVALGQRAIALLRVLIEQPGTPVSKVSLIEAAWPKLAVEESNLTVQIAALRRVFEKEAGGKVWIETLSRRGYRYVGPAVVIEEDSPTTAVTTSPSPMRPDKPSIAVLPFQNLSDDPEQGYFADGIVEEIITSLSRFHRLFVIARSSSITYKDRAIDVKQVGRELGVRYLLEGSVRKANSRVRIAAQLIDADSGHHIWADRYDRDFIDIFAVQDEITEQVVSAVEPQLYAAEGIRAKRKPPESLDAWECVVRALSFVSSRAKTDLDAAAKLLQKAITLDPGYARAHSLLSFITALAAHLGLQPRENSLLRASDAAHKALFLDPDEPWAYYALACVLIFRRETEAGAEECRKALALDPNFALAYTLLGIALCFLGRSEEAWPQFEKAERLSPRDLLTRGNAGVNNMARSWACFIAGRYRDGIEFARKAITESPSLTPAYRILVVNYALAGEIDASKSALKDLKRVQSDLTPGWIKEWMLFTRAEDQRRYLDGFHLAGFI